MSNRKDSMRLMRDDLNREYEMISDNISNNVNEIITDVLKKLSKKECVIDSMSELKAYDYCTYIHSIRVGVYGIIIGFIMGKSEKSLVEIGTAGLLHDIGKIYIPIEIINKKGKLDEIEFNIIKSHVSRSIYEINKKYSFENGNITLSIYEHHERLDGTGYPRQIKGEEISVPGRILAIADVFEAYSSSRAYHEARTVEKTIEFMQSLDGLDADILNKFIEHLNSGTGKVEI